MKEDLEKSGFMAGAHRNFMKEALKEAQKAYEKGEIPIGAVVVLEGKIIARAHNEKEIKQDPTNHAEITAIKRASKKMGSWRLSSCDMYVTLEPCTMCAGALLHSRIRRLYIGTPDPKAGAVGSVLNVLGESKFNHKVEVIYGIMEEECAGILKEFFSDIRKRQKGQ